MLSQQVTNQDPQQQQLKEACKNWWEFLYVASNHSWSSQIVQSLESSDFVDGEHFLCEKMLLNCPEQMIQICGNLTNFALQFKSLVHNCPLWMRTLYKLLTSQNAHNAQNALNVLEWFLRNIESFDIYEKLFQFLFEVCFLENDKFIEVTDSNKFRYLYLLLRQGQSFFLQYPKYARTKGQQLDLQLIYQNLQLLSKSLVKLTSKDINSSKINLTNIYDIFIEVLKLLYAMCISEFTAGRLNLGQPEIQFKLAIEQIIIIVKNIIQNQYFTKIYITLWYLIRLNATQTQKVQNKLKQIINVIYDNSPDKIFQLPCFQHNSILNKNDKIVFYKSTKTQRFWYQQITCNLQQLIQKIDFNNSHKILFEHDYDSFQNLLFYSCKSGPGDSQNSESLFVQLSSFLQQQNLNYLRSSVDILYSLELFEILSIFQFLHALIFDKILSFNYDIRCENFSFENDVFFEVQNDTENLIAANSTLLGLRSRGLHRYLLETQNSNNSSQIQIKNSSISRIGISAVFQYIQYGQSEIENFDEFCEAVINFTDFRRQIPLPYEVFHYQMINSQKMPLNTHILQNKFPTQNSKYNNVDDLHSAIYIDIAQQPTLLDNRDQIESKFLSQYSCQDYLFIGQAHGKQIIVVPLDKEYARNFSPYFESYLSFSNNVYQDSENTSPTVVYPGFLNADVMFTYLLYLFTNRIWYDVYFLSDGTLESGAGKYAGCTCCACLRRLLGLIHAAQITMDEKLYNILFATLESQLSQQKCATTCLTCLLQDSLTLELFEVQEMFISCLSKQISQEYLLLAKGCLPDQILEFVKVKLVEFKREGNTDPSPEI
eukprot:TRINITY_DN16224_c1_g1_i3.p1 TRINITY_DN16224_c1_g1~~TRINITY_DN16224_c1_g1_i3.p1  ORF type:complete len:958 (-),score=62.73 TRINITY_DN16224_c1_g1_i3:104-2581(-)